MKKIIFLCFLGLFFISFLYSKPEISFSVKSFDFGEVLATNGKLHHKFIFTNVGDEPLEIEQVKSSWGCTVTSRSTGLINPGDNGFVKVTFNPSNRKGKFRKSVNIYTNAKPKTVKLDVSGIIIQPFNKINKTKGDIDLQYNTISFGNVYDNEIKVDTIEIVNNDSSLLSIFFEKVPPYLSLEIVPNKIPPTQKGHIISKLYAPKKDTYGFFYERIKMILLNEKLKSNKNIFVTATILPKLPKIENIDSQEVPIIFFPERIKSLNINKNSKEVNCEFSFENRGKSNLIIHKIHVNHGCSVKDFSSLVKPNETGFIKIICDDVDLEKDYKKVIDVISNDPIHTHETLRINYQFNKRDN